MPIKFYGPSQSAATIWSGTETITGQKTFSDTIVGDISSNGTSYFTDICANSIIGDISSNGTSYFTDICANRIYSNPDAGQALIIDSSLIIPDACFNILSNGNVGIGTNSPNYPLVVINDYNNPDVTNSSSLATDNVQPDGVIVTLWGGKSYLKFNSTQSGGGGNLSREIKRECGILCEGGNIIATHSGPDNLDGKGGYVVAFWGHLNSSDERIKYDIEDINDSSALEKLREIKPRTYKYRDDRALEDGGRGTVYGFIAQEVKSIFPQAVRMLGKEHVPNIQEVGVYSSANKTITFTNFDTSGIPTSGVIKVITAKNECKYLDINYISIIDSHTIEVETDISEHCGAYDEENNEFIAGNNIYVEGCQVPDFHLLKKESIFTLATAALQEVDRQLQAEKAKTATLEAKTATLETKTATLETKVATLEAENTDLRADIELIKEHLGISTEVG